MFITLIQKFRQRLLVRQSMGRLLAREDTHLLDDIGLSRHDVEMLMADPGSYAAPSVIKSTALHFRAC